MLTIRTVSYKYMVNGETLNMSIAKRGMGQSDPLSPLIFIIFKEYMHMV